MVKTINLNWCRISSINSGIPQDFFHQQWYSLGEWMLGGNIESIEYSSFNTFNHAVDKELRLTSWYGKYM